MSILQAHCRSAGDESKGPSLTKYGEWTKMHGYNTGNISELHG